MAARRKLTAVDDPLATAGPIYAAARRPAAVRSETPAVAPLYVKLPIAESDALARAAFELRVHKRELVGALIARHVDATTEQGRAALRDAVAAYRDSQIAR